MERTVRLRSNENVRPKIMLSGFDAEAERTYMTNIIKRLDGEYLCDISNPQAFMPACTHVICKKPNRSEKYLAGCASGKWILNPYFLHISDRQDSWAREEDYEWGLNISTMHPSTLQQAPKRWRETIKVKNQDPPFLGWSVGLVMKQTFIQAYTRIIEAGGGAAVDITSWYVPEPVNMETRNMKLGLLTHVLVTPDMMEKVTRFRTEAIPYLKAEYLALYLLNDPPPSTEKYSLFRKNNRDGGLSDCTTHETLSRVGSNSKSKLLVRESHSGDDDTESSSGLSENLFRNSPKENPTSFSRMPNPPAVVQSPRPTVYSSPTKASPKSESSSPQKPSKCVISTAVVKVRTINKAGQNSSSVPIGSPPSTNANPTERSLFKVFENSPSAINLSQAGLRASRMKDTPIQLYDVGGSLPKQTTQKVSPTKRDHVPAISLGKKHPDPDSGSARLHRMGAPNGRPSVFKRIYTESFFHKNYDVLQEFASLRKLQDTPYGMVKDLFDENRRHVADIKPERYARPFSRDVVTSLEASLEVNYGYRYKNFLKEVSGRISSSVYPPSDIIYVIMKVILLDTNDPVLAKSAFSVLQKILKLHPPQSLDIKEVKLYHKAFTLMTVPDETENSPIMLAVGSMLSQSDENWSLWCNQDPTLGTYWTFYSRVLNIAVNPVTPKNGEALSTTESVDAQQKVRNATLLTMFLTKLVEKDYEDVITRNEIPKNNPMIKCLIADLLWPAMTGLEPWFRRPSPNLADLVSLFVKAVEARISHTEMNSSADHDTEYLSDESDDENGTALSAEEDSGILVEQIGRLITVTASWSVYCDIRDKGRGKRTASRPLELELVKALRFELEECKTEVLELALKHLPSRLRLKVNSALIQEVCLDSLVTDEAKSTEELSLEVITSRHMQMMPVVLTGEEEGGNEASKKKYRKSSEPPSEDKNEKPETNNVVTNVPSTMYKVNKRNLKGETPLHLACMSNRPGTVRQLLEQPGINPNLTDYAGWTPLGEACNHGHIECVKALLALPVKKEIPISTSDEPTVLKIDITLCPHEGQTPLHDALGNGHLDIACLLLEKGGVGLLDKVDSDGRTPLDYCSSDAARTYIIEFACEQALKEQKTKISNDISNNCPLMTLAKKDKYKEVIPGQKSESWKDSLRWYVKMTRLLLSHFVTSGYLIRACAVITNNSHCIGSPAKRKNNRESNDVIVINDSDDDDTLNGPIRSSNSNLSSSNVSTLEIQRFANDITYCLRWQECWELYMHHVRQLVGGDSDSFDEVMEDVVSPIPASWAAG